MALAFECAESISRRRFLQASAVLSFAALPDLSFAADARDPRLVVFLLRGGMDGLAIMPPVGDPTLKGKRRDLVPDGVLKLDGFFALHPELKTVHDLYDSGQALLVHGASFPYTGRSHFEGQNIMESGVTKAYASTSGWLGRALDAGGGLKAMAMELPVPLILRGKNPAESRYPTWISRPPAAVFAKLAPLWASDQDLALAGGQVATAGKIPDMDTPIGVGSVVDLSAVVNQAAYQLRRPDGPRVAVIDEVGFDTHAHQPEEATKKFMQLDQAVRGLRSALGETAWKETLVVTVTEFGRTVGENGSTGTDHGWGSCIFVLGGALKKSGIVADWPGLAPASLFEGRDLKATIDARALYGSIVSSTFGIPPDVVRKDVLEFDSTHAFDGYFS